MKYAIPFLVLMAFALPVSLSGPALAQKADMSCVRGDCKKTDPAKEAEKEMHKAAGPEATGVGPIEAPVEGAGETAKTEPVTPPVAMGPDAAIKEIQDAVAKEDAERPMRPDAPVRMSPPGTPSCNPYAQNQVEVNAKISASEAMHIAEQKRIRDKLAEVVRGHNEEQLRIAKVITEGAAEHQKRQPVISDQSAEYQRQMREQGLGIRDKLAAAVQAHRDHYSTLRCLPFERFKNFSHTSGP